jgi:hypothetical protein
MLASGPVRLQLMVGPLVAAPAPRAILDSLESVEVNVGSGDTQTGFSLNFQVSRRSPLHTVFLLGAGNTIPVLRVILVVTVGGVSEALIDGVVTHVQLLDRGAEPILVVQGKDLSVLMDIFELDGLPYPAMADFTRVLLSLAKYAGFGVIPKVIPSIITDVPIPIESIPTHQGTDYYYLKMLAMRAGYVFYLSPGPTPGTSYGYWGPEIRVGAPQPALNVDFDAPHRNVESLTFSFDKEKKEMPLVHIQEQNSKAPLVVPVPDITPLNPPLGLVPPLPPKLTNLPETAKLKPWVAALRGLAYASQHSDAVFGEGTLDVTRYGHILKSRALVGVRGAGEAFDGLYYVAKVTHTIKRGEYKQSFSLARNGLLSTLPKVPA